MFDGKESQVISISRKINVNINVKNPAFAGFFYKKECISVFLLSVVLVQELYLDLLLLCLEGQ